MTGLAPSGTTSGTSPGTSPGTSTGTSPGTSPGAVLDSEADSRYRIDVSRVEPRVLRRITAMAFRHPLRMAVAMVAAVLAGTFQLFVPQFLGRAVDQAQGLLRGAATGAAERA